MELQVTVGFDLFFLPRFVRAKHTRCHLCIQQMGKIKHFYWWILHVSTRTPLNLKENFKRCTKAVLHEFTLIWVILPWDTVVVWKIFIIPLQLCCLGGCRANNGLPHPTVHTVYTVTDLWFKEVVWIFEVVLQEGSNVSVVHTIDGSWHTPSLEKQQEYWCCAVDRVSSKMDFSHLKKMYTKKKKSISI